MNTEQDSAAAELPNAVSFGPDGKPVQAELSPEAMDAQEKIGEREAATEATAAEVLAALNPRDEVIVVEKEIEVAGVPKIFHIKQLSYAEKSRVEAKKFRKTANHQIVRDIEHEETWGMAWILAAAVVHNKGTAQEPVWTPLFTVQDIVGKGGKGGIMNSAGNGAEQFIYELLGAIWEVNPSMNPLAQALAASQTGLA